MGEKGNATDFSSTAGGSAGDAARGAASAAAEARGEGGESTGAMVGELAAKTGGEFLAGAVLGAATEKIEDRSKRRAAAKKSAGSGPAAKN